MTTRLYYDDSHSREFDATVVRTESRGGTQAVWLDRSGFYPTSGGQPFDTGVLNVTAVVDVVDEDDDVVHLTTDGTFTVGDRVHGRIDWPRRFDHMQQHSGQHMLSAAFVRAVNVPTLSFHLGAELSTIDLARDVTAEDITSAEATANEVVWEDRPVSVRYVDASEATAMGLRKESQRSGTLRLVDIADFDLSACGGSHVTRTGAVGVIAVSGWERFKGGLRVEFVCGGRALKRHRLLRDTVTASTRHLSVLTAELPAAIDRLQGELRQQKRTLAEQEQALSGYRAAELASAAQAVGDLRIVAAAVAGDAAALKGIASAIVAAPGHVVVLVSTATPAAIVAMRSADAGTTCDAIVRTMCARFGGRGGGRPDLAQAGGLTGSPEEMVAEARRLLGGS